MPSLKTVFRVAVSTLLAAAGLAGAVSAETRFAFVPGQNTLLHDDREAALLASYLERQLQSPVHPVAFPSTPELLQALTGGELDFAVIPNTAWRTAQKGLVVLANFTRSADPTHELLLLTAKRREFHSVEELLETTPDLVMDQDVPSRHNFIVAQSGRTIADGFASLHVPRRAVKGVSGLLNDTYGAACVESSVLDTVKRFDRGMARQLHILASAGPYASDPIVAPATTAEFFTQKLADALLAMNQDSRGQQVLLGLKINRFVEPIAAPEMYPAVATPRPAEPTPDPPAAEAPPAPAPPSPGQEAEAGLDTRRAESYAEVVRLDTLEAYRAFLAMYPDSPESADVLRRRTELETEDKLYQESKDSAEKLSAYLSLFPRGRHGDVARARIAELQAVHMETDYWKAAAEKTPEALRGFLAKWPDSKYAPAAESALASLAAAERAAVEPTPAPSPPVDTEPAPPEPPKRWVLLAPFVGTSPTPKGLGAEPAWGEATTLPLPLDGKNGPRTLKVAALHDGTKIYLMARWPDPTEDSHQDPWRWDNATDKYLRERRSSDGLGVFWYRGPTPTTSCMISGEEVDADAWMWRPQWSELSGLTDDWTVRVSRTRLPKANPYTTLDGSGQVWVRRAPDHGEPGWQFVVPLENAGVQVSSYAAQECTGSRCDVRGAARWSDQGWTVVMERVLDTGQPDDVALVPGSVAKASFAVYDHAGRADHTSSPMVEVRLAPRP